MRVQVDFVGKRANWHWLQKCPDRCCASTTGRLVNLYQYLPPQPPLSDGTTGSRQPAFDAEARARPEQMSRTEKLPRSRNGSEGKGLPLCTERTGGSGASVVAVALANFHPSTADLCGGVPMQFSIAVSSCAGAYDNKVPSAGQKRCPGRFHSTGCNEQWGGPKCSPLMGRRPRLRPEFSCTKFRPNLRPAPKTGFW